MKTVQPTHEIRLSTGSVILAKLQDDASYAVVGIEPDDQLASALGRYVGYGADLSSLFDWLSLSGAGHRFDPTDGAPIAIKVEVIRGGQTTQEVVYRGLMSQVVRIPPPR